MSITIILWLTTLILFILTTVALVLFILRNPEFRAQLRICLDGIRHGLSTSGFHMREPRQKVTLYKWMPMDNACAEAYDREEMAPKDIIDWMEIGLPGTPEMRRQCPKDCRCRLMAVKRPSEKNHHPPI